MSWLSRAWEEHVLPRAVERCCGQRTIARQREKVVPKARGRVLEIGVGSGLNLAFYDRDRVTEVIAVDPSPALLDRARSRAARASIPVELAERSVDHLDAPDASFDTVVMTYTLCSVPDPAHALFEIRRVLAPRGQLLVSEHGLAPDASVRSWQRRLTPMWSRLGGGCHLDRPMRELFRDAGFETHELEEAYLPGPRWLNYHSWGAMKRTENRE